MIIIILSLANIISSVVSIVVLGFLYFQYRDRIQGINFWILSHLFLLLSLVFSISRLVIPEEIAILLTNSFQAFSFILLFIGMSRFLSKPIKLTLPLLFYVICMSGIIYFTLGESSLIGRQSFLFVYGFYLCSTIAYFLIKSRVKQLGKTVGFAAIVVFLIALTSAFGLIFALTTHRPILFSRIISKISLPFRPSSSILFY